MKMLYCQDFNKSIGKFHQSVFVPESTLALTGTSEGHSIVWENEGDFLTQCNAHQHRVIVIIVLVFC